MGFPGFETGRASIIAVRALARCGSNAARGNEAPCIGHCREGVDAYAPAARGRVDETHAIQRDADVQLLARQVEKDQIPARQRCPLNGHAGLELLLGGAWHREPRRACRIPHEAAAVEAAGCIAAIAIRLAEHRERSCGEKLGRTRGLERCGGRAGLRRAAWSGRHTGYGPARAGGERDSDCDRGHGEGRARRDSIERLALRVPWFLAYDVPAASTRPGVGIWRSRALWRKAHEHSAMRV